MRCWVPMLMLLALLAACAPTRETARYTIGVSGDRLANATTPANAAAMRGLLDRRARQICTSGYRIVKVDTIPAKDGRQIVDLELICNPYRPGLPALASLASNF
ncbi:MAG: hypothetical protein ACREFD_00800 [Stellaceae bacterium]